MNRKIITAGVILATVLAGAVLFLFLFKADVPQTPTEQDAETLPIADSRNGGDTSARTISLTTESGANIQAYDFLDDPTTVQSPANSEYYYLGFNFVTNPTNDVPYVIAYVDSVSYFNIVLYHEPIGTTRRRAETYLMNQLGLSQDEMCELKYTVVVPYRINEFYAGEDLRFSFCPDSVQLPE